MKRFHVHVHVQDLAKSIAFYAKLFGAEPTRSESDYAKWMLDDPPVNFAISSRSAHVGIDHLGIQVDNAQELAELKSRAAEADLTLLDEGQTTCCYARSDKYWVTDPQGIAWEHFNTLGNIPVFNETREERAVEQTSACCAPSPAAGCAPRSKPLDVAIKPASSCC